MKSPGNTGCDGSAFLSSHWKQSVPFKNSITNICREKAKQLAASELGASACHRPCVPVEPRVDNPDTAPSFGLPILTAPAKAVTGISQFFRNNKIQKTIEFCAV